MISIIKQLHSPKSVIIVANTFLQNFGVVMYIGPTKCVHMIFVHCFERESVWNRNQWYGTETGGGME